MCIENQSGSKHLNILTVFLRVVKLQVIFIFFSVVSQSLTTYKPYFLKELDYIKNMTLVAQLSLFIVFCKSMQNVIWRTV